MSAPGTPGDGATAVAVMAFLPASALLGLIACALLAAFGVPSAVAVALGFLLLGPGAVVALSAWILTATRADAAERHARIDAARKAVR